MNKIILKKGKGFYRIPLLEDLGVKALFTTRLYDMGFDGDGRQKAYSNLGINWKDLISISQVHGDKIVKVSKRDRAKGLLKRETAIQDTDAIFTNTLGLPISILTADCLPVFLFDPKERAAALAHAGWRGAHKNIASKTFIKMKKEFGCLAHDVVAVFGPSIGPCCYEVGKEFLQHFPGHVAKRKNKLYLNLAASVRNQLEGVGVKDCNIFDVGICTACMGNEFFSYRREGKFAGRSMSILEVS